MRAVCVLPSDLHDDGKFVPLAALVDVERRGDPLDAVGGRAVLVLLDRGRYRRAVDLQRAARGKET